MRKLADYIRDLPKEPFTPTPVREVLKPKVVYYPDDPEEIARSEQSLKSQAGKPERKPDGTLLYHCQVCKDMGYLRAEVPVGHRLFGRMRPCPCNPQYDTIGPKWS